MRQEAHPDEFDDLRRIVLWLGARTTTVGTVGHLRFHEAHIPDVLIAEAGAVRRETLGAGAAVKTPDQVIPHLYA